ncbi:hypothetical protein OG21DRAFT_1489721 [Imleria badia]|nr:hypothetical protein OG21DRAFT_1489721 [Imleria badia]
MANPLPQMPLRGSTSALKFDRKNPALLPRFLEDVDLLGTAAGLSDAQKIRTSIQYADLEESEGWELLPAAMALPAVWNDFITAVKALYPGCKVQEYRAKPMRTLADLSEYKRKFMKVSQFLINGRFLSELDRETTSTHCEKGILQEDKTGDSSPALLAFIY